MGLVVRMWNEVAGVGDRSINKFMELTAERLSVVIKSDMRRLISIDLPPATLQRGAETQASFERQTPRGKSRCQRVKRHGKEWPGNTLGECQAAPGQVQL